MRRAVFLLAIIVLLGAPAVWAQPIEDGGGSQPFMTEAPEAWGTSDATVYTVQPYECSTLYSTDVWQPYPGFTSRYIETPNGGFVCSVHLPTGANVYLMYLDSCDTSSSGQVRVWLRTIPAMGGNPSNLAYGSTGDAWSGGCGWQGVSVSPGHTVDNYAEGLTVQVSNTSYEGKTRWSAVRLFYKLQVSPAPASATFGDVPTSHAYFRYIEALADSGITGGCGGGNFCPNSPVTRGQMAVYLATALGLSYPY